MPRFLDTRGNAVIAIFICDRCKMKRPIIEAMPDPNFPGLKVCQQGCADEKDPYRLPARKTERITLQFPRPDVSVATNDSALLTGGLQQYDISTEQNTQTPEQTGNNDIISPDYVGETTISDFSLGGD
jgi:hypothetical protein